MHISRFVKICGAAPETYGPYDDLGFYHAVKTIEGALPGFPTFCSLSDCTARCSSARKCSRLTPKLRHASPFSRFSTKTAWSNRRSQSEKFWRIWRTRSSDCVDKATCE